VHRSRKPPNANLLINLSVKTTTNKSNRKTFFSQSNLLGRWDCDALANPVARRAPVNPFRKKAMDLNAFSNQNK
jgi:hypothetical protein